MSIRTLFAVLAIAGSISGMAVIATQHTSPRATASIRCGVELWSIKTLTDSSASAVDLNPRASTITQLNGLTPPSNESNTSRTRSTQEDNTYAISATLTGYRLEADSDYHLVLSSGSKTMIAEIPDPACAQGSRVLSQITQAQTVFLAHHSVSSECFACLSEPVTITGVLFFDLPHGQVGVADNAVELHPVISFSEGTNPPPPTTTTTTIPTTTTTPSHCYHWYHHVYHRTCKPYYYPTKY